jgi:hypothetical protein
MSNAKSKAVDLVAAAMIMGAQEQASARAEGYYEMECFDAAGKLKWKARSKNLVVNVGLKDMCDKYFLGAAYTAAWFIGIYGAAASNNPAAGDTAAVHAGWTEVVPYSNATRPAATFVAASAANPSVITNAASPAVFNINATSVVGGAFLISNNVKSGTTGILFSAADLQAPGDRNVANGDVLNVTYRFELTAT